MEAVLEPVPIEGERLELVSERLLELREQALQRLASLLWLPVVLSCAHDCPSIFGASTRAVREGR